MDIESQWVYDRMRLYQLMRTHLESSPKSLAEAVGRSERWGRKWVQRFKTVTARSHQGLDQQIPVPKVTHKSTGPVGCRTVLGGILHDYYRDAA